MTDPATTARGANQPSAHMQQVSGKTASGAETQFSGRLLRRPALEPFWAEAEALGAFIMMHYLAAERGREERDAAARPGASVDSTDFGGPP